MSQKLNNKPWNYKQIHDIKPHELQKQNKLSWGKEQVWDPNNFHQSSKQKNINHPFLKKLQLRELERAGKTLQNPITQNYMLILIY